MDRLLDQMTQALLRGQQEAQEACPTPAAEPTPVMLPELFWWAAVLGEARLRNWPELMPPTDGPPGLRATSLSSQLGFALWWDLMWVHFCHLWSPWLIWGSSDDAACQSLIERDAACIPHVAFLLKEHDFLAYHQGQA